MPNQPRDPQGRFTAVQDHASTIAEALGRQKPVPPGIQALIGGHRPAPEPDSKPAASIASRLLSPHSADYVPTPARRPGLR